MPGLRLPCEEAWAVLRALAPGALHERDVAASMGCSPASKMPAGWAVVRPDMWLEARGENVLCWVVLYAEVVARTHRRLDPRFGELTALATTVLAAGHVEFVDLDGRPRADEVLYNRRPADAE